MTDQPSIGEVSEVILTAVEAGGEARPDQRKYMTAVADFYEKSGNTSNYILGGSGGIGKTIGYLIPSMVMAVRENKPVVIAARTRAHKEQIVADYWSIRDVVCKHLGTDVPLRHYHGARDFLSPSRCETLYNRLKETGVASTDVAVARTLWILAEASDSESEADFLGRFSAEEKPYVEEILQTIKAGLTEVSWPQDGEVERLLDDGTLPFSEDLMIAVQDVTLDDRGTTLDHSRKCSGDDGDVDYKEIFSADPIPAVVVMTHTMAALGYRVRQALGPPYRGETNEEPQGPQIAAVVIDEAETLVSTGQMLMEADIPLSPLRGLVGQMAEFTPVPELAVAVREFLDFTAVVRNSPAIREVRGGAAATLLIHRQHLIRDDRNGHQVFEQFQDHVARIHDLLSEALRQYQEVPVDHREVKHRRLEDQIIRLISGWDRVRAAFKPQGGHRQNVKNVKLYQVLVWDSNGVRLGVWATTPGAILQRLWWSPVPTLLTSAAVVLPGTRQKASQKQFERRVGIPAATSYPSETVTVEVKKYGKAELILPPPDAPTVNIREKDGKYRFNPDIYDFWASMVVGAQQAGGRTVVLCNSYRDIHALAAKLPQRHLIIQDPAKPLAWYKEKFRQDEWAIFLTVMWEGLDLPGMIQNCVLTRIPRSPPAFPLDEVLAKTLRDYREDETEAGDLIGLRTNLETTEAIRRGLQGFYRGIRGSTEFCRYWLGDTRFPLPGWVALEFQDDGLATGVWTYKGIIPPQYDRDDTPVRFWYEDRLITLEEMLDVIYARQP